MPAEGWVAQPSQDHLKQIGHLFRLLIQVADVAGEAVHWAESRTGYTRRGIRAPWPLGARRS